MAPRDTPERQAFRYAIGRIVGEGYTLTNRDIAEEIAPYYGVRIGAIRDIMTSKRMKTQLAQMTTESTVEVQAVKLETERYMGVIIYKDGSLDDKQLKDIENTKNRIDDIKAKS
jgi:hypothetical protein